MLHNISNCAGPCALYHSKKLLQMCNARVIFLHCRDMFNCLLSRCFDYRSIITRVRVFMLPVCNGTQSPGVSDGRNETDEEKKPYISFIENLCYTQKKRTCRQSVTVELSSWRNVCFIHINLSSHYLRIVHYNIIRCVPKPPQ